MKVRERLLSARRPSRVAADEGFKCFQTTCKRRRKVETKASVSGTGRLQKHRFRRVPGNTFAHQVSQVRLFSVFREMTFKKERAHSARCSQSVLQDYS